MILTGLIDGCVNTICHIIASRLVGCAGFYMRCNVHTCEDLSDCGSSPFVRRKTCRVHEDSNSNKLLQLQKCLLLTHLISPESRNREEDCNYSFDQML